MPQGGFGRDYQHVTLLQNRAAEKQLEIQRQKIGREVMDAIQEQLGQEVERIETEVIEEYENSLQAIAHAVESKNKTLWFLIYVAGLSMLTTAGLLGFLTARFF
jgi:predicted neutral ceramidase superfamily lipid hydrolase